MANLTSHAKDPRPRARADPPRRFCRRGPKIRKDQGAYTGVSIIHTPKEGDYKTDCAGDVGCATFKIRKGERFLNLKINDQTGEVVFGQVILDGDFAHPLQFCESLTKIDVRGTKTIQVMVGASNANDKNCPGPATTGTISAAFS